MEGSKKPVAIGTNSKIHILMRQHRVKVERKPQVVTSTPATKDKRRAHVCTCPHCPEVGTNYGYFEAGHEMLWKHNMRCHKDYSEQRRAEVQAAQAAAAKRKNASRRGKYNEHKHFIIHRTIKRNKGQ